MKIDFNKKEELKKLIEQSYFKSGSMGKLAGKKYSLSIKKDDPFYIMLKGLNNMIVRLYNHELIEGSLRMLVDEHDWGVNLFPCSIYCIVEDEKYSFY